MIAFETSMRVERPVEEVFAFVEQPEVIAAALGVALERATRPGA